MAYCPNCGNEVERELTPEQQEERALIEVERIRADKEIALAKLARNMAREELETTETVVEMQTEAQVEAAVAEAEIVGAAVEASELPEAQPIEIVDSAPAEPEPENDMVPPEAEHHEHDTGRKSPLSGLGMW